MTTISEAEALPHAAVSTGRRRGSGRISAVGVSRIVLVFLFLGAWEGLPRIPGIADRIGFLDTFFISSPSLVAQKLWDLGTGANATSVIWPSLAVTLVTALSGTLAAIVVGAGLGLFLSNWPFGAKVLQPFIVAANAIPRVTIIPIIVIAVGTSSVSDAITALTVVVFLVFFNAFEGGRSIPPEVLQNAHILGASPRSIMFDIRFPYVLAWTFASLPNAISFGLVGSVTAELFTGSTGIGQVLLAAVYTSNASLTFAVVTLLTAVGLILVLGAGWLRSRLLSWWDYGG